MPRWIHKLYAYVMGYFWLPCPSPRCGEMFGGHEAGRVVWHGKMTCKRHYWYVSPEYGPLLMTDG